MALNTSNSSNLEQLALKGLNDLLFRRTCQNILLCFVYDSEVSVGLLNIVTDAFRNIKEYKGI